VLAPNIAMTQWSNPSSSDDQLGGLMVMWWYWWSWLPWVVMDQMYFWSRMASRGKLVFNWVHTRSGYIGVHVREVRDRYMTHILHAIWLARLQRGAYMSADTLERAYIILLSAECLQRQAYMLADTLGVCIYYMAVGWHTCSGGAYMSVTHLECTYIAWPLAGTLSVTKHLCQLACIEHAYYYYPPFGWHLKSEGTYMSAHMHWAHNISGPMRI